MPDQRDIEDDDQAHPDKPEKPEKQQPVFERWLPFSPADVFPDGHGHWDLTAPRSGFGHEEFY
jgi:hypothetical protein